MIQALNANAITTAGDVMLVGTVGEEELGNLRGVKALFRDHRDIDGFISIDGLGITRVVNRATGSLRYEMIFRGPGGHSFQEFGLPSAIHAMGRAITGIADLETPAEPKTTFTVGTVRGGTSVNAIAGEAHMTVDLRSNATEELLKLKAQVLALVSEAAAEENKRWGSNRITVEINLIGERPAGVVAKDRRRSRRRGARRRRSRRGLRRVCGREHQLQPCHVARHPRGHHRRRRRRRKLALAQRMVPADGCILGPQNALLTL